MSHRRPRRTAEQWQQIVDQQRASGLNVAEFARQHDLPYQSLAARCRTMPLSDEKLLSLSEAAEDPIPHFVELGVVQAPHSHSPSWLVELDLGDGLQLRIGRAV